MKLVDTSNWKDHTVWYLGYGSNLNSNRFRKYIVGGEYGDPVQKYDGCTDKTLPPSLFDPIKNKPRNVVLRHRIYFSHFSSTWNNQGLAFIESNQSDKHFTYARIYSIKLSQLIEIWAQENGVKSKVGVLHDTQIISSFLELLKPNRKENYIDLEGDFRYGRLLLITNERSSEESTPHHVVTFTESADRFSPLRVPPSEKYLATICSGIMETFPELDAESELYEYLINYALCNPRQARLSILLAQDLRSRPFVEEKANYCSKLFEFSKLRRLNDNNFPEYCYNTQSSEQLTNELYEVESTTDRSKAQGDYIIYLSKNYGEKIPKKVLLEKFQKNIPFNSNNPSVLGRVLKISAYVDSTNKPTNNGRVALDFTLRTALSVTPSSSDMTGNSGIRGDWIRVTPLPFSKTDAFNRFCQMKLKTPVLIVRVQKAAHIDMENNVCRLSPDAFRLLSVEPGDYIVLESISCKLKMRALLLTTELVKERERTIQSRHHINIEKELALNRLGSASQDLPAIFLDMDARNSLGLEVGDVLRVRRSNAHIIRKVIHSLGLPILVGLLAGVLVGIPTLLADSKNISLQTVVIYLSLVGVAVFIVILVILFSLRSHLGNKYTGHHFK